MPASRLMFSLLLLVVIPAVAAAQSASASLSGIVVDDVEAEFVGEWKQSSASRGYVGQG